MILNIRVDYITSVKRDLLVLDDFDVKIRMSGNPNPIMLTNGECNNTPMRAKDFFERTERCEKEKKGMGSVVEENIDTDKQKAWLCDCDDDCDYAENMTFSTDEQNNTVLISFT